MARASLSACMVLSWYVLVLVTTEVSATARPLIEDAKAASAAKPTKAIVTNAQESVTAVVSTPKTGAETTVTKDVTSAKNAKPLTAVETAATANSAFRSEVVVDRNPDAAATTSRKREFAASQGTADSSASDKADASRAYSAAATKSARSPPPPSLGHECKACLAWRATAPQASPFSMTAVSCQAAQDVMSSSILLHLATMGRISENFTVDSTLCEAKSASICGSLHYNDEQDATIYVAWLEALLGRLFSMSCNDSPALFDISLEASPADPGMCPQLYSSRYCQPAAGTAKV